MDGIAHIASAAVEVPAGFAVERLADPGFVGGWALGSMGLTASEVPGVFRGASLFDGSTAHVAIEAHPALGLIDFRVGRPKTLRRRISIRVAPAGLDGDLGGERCLVALMAWRGPDASDDGWARTCTTHGTEILLIKAQLEAGYRGERRA